VSIPEHEATGDIARLYADLRAVTGLPFVNLIYRHLAAVPGALPWCWAQVRPVYSTGRAAQVAGELTAALAPSPVPTWSMEQMRRAAVPPDALPGIRAVLDQYHRANPLNLVPLAALLARMNGAPEGSGTGADPSHPAPRQPMPSGLQDLPPMLTEQEMGKTAADALWGLARLGITGPLGDMPSALRHLAHWPGLLVLALETLQPLADRCWLAQEIDTLRERRDRLVGQVMASGLLARDGLPELPAPEVRDQVRALLTRFTDGMIVRMVPQLTLLRQLVPKVPQG
jgi:hypothetical protein